MSVQSLCSDDCNDSAIIQMQEFLKLDFTKWRGSEKIRAHLLLFFMAFVFGAFCTFCFHMLMYLFDEKCVLFPQLLSLTSLRHNVIFEFLPLNKEGSDMLPLDFLTTQWTEKSACYLPTYVPLISGIFGLVWTTMFLMCSTGSRTLHGLQRPWRVLPPVFVFSLAMGCLCIYSSAVTHNGLDELCLKLGEITGSPTCTYTVNVATLAYERRIRGVYQAIRLTILSAWLHTICWLLSALLTLARVVLAVDFQLVRVNVDLIGDIDKMMEHHEKQIRTVSPDVWFKNERSSPPTPQRYAYERTFTGTQTEPPPEDVEVIFQDKSVVLFTSENPPPPSETSLLPEEVNRLARLKAYENIPQEHQFILQMVSDIINKLPDSAMSIDLSESDSELRAIVRQLGVQHIPSDVSTTKPKKIEYATAKEAQEVAKQLRRQFRIHDDQETRASTSAEATSYPTRLTIYDPEDHKSELTITPEMKQIIENNKKLKLKFKEDDKDFGDRQKNKKSNLKSTGAQTIERKSTAQKVQIAEPDDTDESATNTSQNIEKETQTDKPKEKQD